MRERVWDAWVSVVTLLLAIELPVHLALQVRMPGYDVLYWLATAILAADLVVQLRKKRSWIAIDLLAAAPLGLLPGGTAWEAIRLIKLVRVGGHMQHLRQRSIANGAVLQLVFFALWLVITAHWLACGWIVLGGEARVDPQTTYIRALYWCITTLATVGYGDIVPKTNGQMVYAMVVMLLGVGIYGYVIGNVANILANLDTAKRHYMESMERLAVFLRYRRVPVELQRRIRDYHAYLWNNQMGYDESAVLDNLPHNLRTEVAVHLRRELIEKSPLFKDASQELVRDLALRLRPALFIPGDLVFKYGNHGTHMFFISRGEVDILDREGNVLTVLRDGDFFGEMALLFEQKRTASARVPGYAELYSLDKASFDHATERYTDFVTQIRREAERRSSN